MNSENKQQIREKIKDIFARSCKNNEYFGNDGWYELHTPTLTQEIESLIKEALNKQLDKTISVIEGNRIDREATRKHMESKNATDEQLLNMEVEADDLDDTIDGIVSAFKEMKEEI